MNKTKIFETVKGYILDQLPVTADRVTENALLVEELGADSANVMMLVMDLESEFNITVEDDALGKIKKVSDIVDYIAERV